MSSSRLTASSFLLLLAIFALSGCRAADARSDPALADAAPCALAFAAHTGRSPLDLEITRLQSEAKTSKTRNRSIEKLGWTFVEKARLSNDPGFYRLAEQCALCIEASQPEAREAWLLRGHALTSMHRFKEAEPLARKLTEQRKLPYDFGLLGDVLMEQGRLSEALPAYQKMMDLKPGPQAYSRAAHMRWLKGDLQGAIEMMKLAASASGSGDTEAGAWSRARLALYQLQAGNTDEASKAVADALGLLRDYAPALLAEGRIHMAAGKAEAAARSLALAAKLNPLPEYQWAFAEGLRLLKKEDEAHAAETALIERGAANDPRTLSLYLSTRQIEPERALRLAEEEMKARQDVFSYDTLAWAQSASGQHEAAYQSMRKAVSEGTKDARLFYHASVVARNAGKSAEATRYRQQAQSIRQMLLPSERESLTRQTTTSR